MTILRLRQGRLLLLVLVMRMTITKAQRVLDYCTLATTYDPENGPYTFSDNRYSLTNHACSDDNFSSTGTTNCCVLDKNSKTCVLQSESGEPLYDCYLPSVYVDTMNAYYNNICNQATFFDPTHPAGTYSSSSLSGTRESLNFHGCAASSGGTISDCCVLDENLLTCVTMKDGRAEFDCFLPDYVDPCSQAIAFNPEHDEKDYAFPGGELLLPLTSHPCFQDGSRSDCCVMDPFRGTCYTIVDAYYPTDCYVPYGFDGRQNDPCREATMYDPHNLPGTYSSKRVSLFDHACSRDGTISDCCLTDPALGTCVLVLDGYYPAYDCYFDQDIAPPEVIVDYGNDYPNCHGYVTGYDESFLPNEPPKPIPCGGPYLDYVFPSFQDASCCSHEGRYFVQSGQIGGFDAGYEYNVRPECYAYSGAMSMVLCDPRQGDFITNNNVLRICRSSCDMLFDACGLPGESYPEWTYYYDGTSLCYELFGGFGSTPCESRKEGYVCQAGLTVEVVDGTDCLNMIEPDYNIYDEEYLYGGAPDACAKNTDSERTDLIVGIVVFVILVLVSCCCCLLCCFLARSCCGKKEGAGHITHPEVEATAKIEPVTGETPFSAQEPPMAEAKLVRPTMGEAEGWTTQQAPSEHVELAGNDEIEIVGDSANNPSKPPSVNPSFRANGTLLVKATQPPRPLPDSSHTEPTVRPPLVSLDQVVAKADSHNQAQVAKEWMQEHSTAAEALTPNEIADVLSKVTFSLQQATVAEVLAVGMGNGLTCEHVVAAMQKCSLQREDVAKCMVPYVQDPQNKEILLAEIMSPYERKQISKCFRN